MTRSADSDSNFIAESLPIFIGEAQEQIESIEQLLLRLEDAPDDRDLLDSLFRCAHTVKGSAGIFGLTRVVAFTHHVETLLDRLREGHIAFDAGLGTLLLRCNDQIRALVGSAGQPEVDDDDGAAERAALVVDLQAASAEPDTRRTASADEPQRSDGSAAASAGAASAGEVPAPGATPGWHITAAFGPETYRNGMDPLAILGYLDKLGNVTQVEVDQAAVPSLDDVDPETCHLAFDLWLVGDTTRAQIEAAFTFVRDDCKLQILEPSASTADFVRRIEAMPDRPRLGEVLVGAGAVSPVQLQQALAAQSEALRKEGQTRPLGEMLQAATGVSDQVVTAALHKQQKPREAAAAAPAFEDQRFIRVQADRLDAVINLLGELVIASAGASMLAQQTRQRALGKANQQVGRLIEEIRNSTLQLRMVPIGETFSRFRRVVRDTAAELGKDVVLDLQGGETELDKSVVERIADPLMHLVRNALDHGLETAADRVAAGKPGQGRLTLSACHEAGSILIRISDDGRGIHRERVLQRAHERGLVPRDVVPPDADILKLIFEPGFSTAEKVTNLSGRGVGMDVVRRNIEALRGAIQVNSEQGQGCCIEIRLPLTLAIIDGFLVGVGASKFIFPLDAVVEVIENRPNVNAPDARGRSVVELRGQVLPVISLRQLYGLDADAPERGSVVVLKSGTQRFGVIVDQLLGQHQTVIKPLGRLFRSLRGMSGSSILGNGEVALIFDAASLCQVAADPPGTRRHPVPAADPALASIQPQSEGQPS
jgi:two-component system, chemotaxis family, sensor kinase CheA